jgi:hypothetical protein
MNVVHHRLVVIALGSSVAAAAILAELVAVTDGKT